MGFFSFFSKEKKETLDKGLSKTKESVFGKIARAVAGKSKVDDEVLDNLEEVLITSDVGVETTLKVIERIEKRAADEKYMNAQELNMILRDEIAALLTENNSDDVDDFETPITKKPYVIMVVGVNGVGKTTTIGKLAYQFKKAGKSVYLGAADTFRAAAVEQLVIWGERGGVPVIKQKMGADPASVAFDTLSSAVANNADVVIIDTAGRLHIDEELMTELKNVKANVKPHEILLVVDSMTGQDAVNVAKAFNEALGIDGVVLTKLDGDTRGGAAISVKKITGRPIKFAATGEKLSDIEVFYPERMASRILGMGDVLSIIEKAEEAIDIEEAEKLEKQLKKKKDLDLDDYLTQLRQIKKMGSFSSLLKMIPGMNQLKDVKVDDKEFVRIEAMISSMTKEERRNPKLLNGNRRIRIAKGSGTSVQEINKFMKSFEMTQKMMRQMKDSKNMKKMMKGLNPQDLKNMLKG